MSRTRGMSGVEVLVIVAILVLLIAIILPAIGVSRRTASGVQRNTQLRGIHQGLVTYAQGNNRWFFGLDNHGNGNPTVEQRFMVGLKDNYLTAEYIISPVESKTAYVVGLNAPLTTDHYSFAMLQINPGALFEEGKPIADGPAFGRRMEWRDTINTDAPVLSDRNTGTVSAPQSVHTNQPGNWRGSVAYNDNHVVFETRHVLPKTIYSTVENTDDHLFEAAGDNDALLIFSGTGE